MELSCMAICVYQFLLIFSSNLTWGDQMHLLGKYSFVHSILLLTNIQKSSNLNYQTDKYSVKLQRTSKECGHTTMLLSFYVIHQNRKKSFWSHVYFLYSIGMYIFSNFLAKATVLFSEFCHICFAIKCTAVLVKGMVKPTQQFPLIH